MNFKEFAGMTPRQLVAMRKAYKAQIDRAELLPATLVTWYANVHRDTEAKPEGYTLGDFWAGAKSARSPAAAGPPTEPGKPQTIEEQRSILRNLCEAVKTRKPTTYRA